MSFLRVLKWISLLLGSVVTFILLTLGWVVFTESGTAAVWRVTTVLVPELHADSVQGPLSEGLSVSNVVYQTELLTVELRDADLEWQLNWTVLEKLQVSKLHLTGLSVTIPEQDENTEPGQPADLPASLPLPMEIVLADVKLTDFKLFAAEPVPLLEISQASLRGKVSAEEILLRSLKVHSPLFTLAGSAKTVLSDRYRTQSELSWTLSAENTAEARGSLIIDGNQEKIHYKLLADVGNDSYGDISLEASGDVSPSELAVHSLSVDHAQSAATLSAAGRLDFAEQNPSGSFDIHWTDLQWPLQLSSEQASEPDGSSRPMTGLRSEKGQISLSGTLEQYSARIQASVSTPGALDGNIALIAAGNSSSIDISNIDIRALKGAAHGAANIRWQDELIANFKLQGKNFDPGEIFPQWRGDISFVASGSQRGELTNLDKLSANGVLRGQAFKLESALSHNAGRIALPRLALSAGNSRLSVTGDIGDQLNLDWNLYSPDLGELLPDATGEINSKGSVKGEIPWPTVHANLSTSNLKVGRYSIAKAQLVASVDPLSKHVSSLIVDASQLLISDIIIDTVKFSASGTRSLHSASLAVSSEAANLAMAVGGGWEDGAWRGALNSAAINFHPFDSWNLGQPQPIQIAADRQVVAKGCWLSAGARVCLQAERHKDQVNSSVELFELPFAYFQSLLSPAVAVQGSVSGTGGFNYTGAGQWSTQGSLSTSGSEIALRESEDQAFTSLIKMEPGALNFKGDNRQISSDFTLPIEDGGSVNGNVSIVQNNNAAADAALQGDIAMYLPDIKFLSVFSQELQSLSGELKVDVQLRGTPQSPLPTGKILLSDAQVKLATPGLALSNIELSATGDGNGDIDYRGTARSGEGSLEVAGNSSLKESSQHSELQISGSDFQVWSTADARVSASPELTVVITDQLVDITGDINIPLARIAPQQLPSGAITVSPDQVIVMPETDSEQDAAGKKQRDIRVRANLALGEKVEMEGFGFKGRMEGLLAVVQEPDSQMVASGELKILDGEYRAYGQGLVIDRGQILFAGGAIDNPGVRIRALRRPAPGIVVGIYVNGELRQPEVSIFSEPGMNESEQLSWLVLGRPMQNSSGAENDYITQAAIALGMKGGNFLTKSIGQTVGLDTIGFEAGSGEAGASSDASEAALVLGKYLTPKLYVSYGLGLLDSLSTVKLRYLITDSWNLVTESSALDSSVDISYSFER